MFDPTEHAHRRRNLLTGEWVLVSPHRSKRPWQGDTTAVQRGNPVSHDADCHLCPGNERANGSMNPDYVGTFVFENDFAALAGHSPAPEDAHPIFTSSRARGEARVICFSPDHSRTLPDMSEREIELLVDCWCDQSSDLGRRWSYVQIFENKGAMMGCSSPHPHGQVWAGDFVPTIVAREDACQLSWLQERGEVMLDEVVAAERGGPRVLEEDEHWQCIVPWWATWPFETLLVAKDSVTRLEQLGGAARRSLARQIRRLTARYDNLFGTSFPYSAGWHGAPHSVEEASHWRLHMHFLPPLLRSATIRKFMVGYEMLAESQRDLTPEQAAERLRAAAPELGR